MGGKKSRGYGRNITLPKLNTSLYKTKLLRAKTIKDYNYKNFTVQN